MIVSCMRGYGVPWWESRVTNNVETLRIFPDACLPVHGKKGSGKKGTGKMGTGKMGTGKKGTSDKLGKKGTKGKNVIICKLLLFII